ncbi:MAG: L-seryl-tRNA(Sec) selenium transferase [Planctomycetota bacterium]|nr:L-seryl-tRNA(Sec) selenium transferase [Planctomycetota bacterium]
MSRPQTDSQAAYRLLPSIDEVLRDPRAAPLEARSGRELLQRFAAETLEVWRAEIKAGRLDADRIVTLRAAGEPYLELERRARREEGRGVVRCVNATGVVLNTGLGRAPVHPEVAEVMAVAARSYDVLEVDRATNERNQRDDYLGELLARMTGAEAGIGVNNCAAAVLLLFNTFAGGREAIVSRGELVEIGGSFRVPDVMARANAALVEVGTTNRTRVADYESAITGRTGLVVKVHTSNFRVVGFTEEASPAELAELGRRRGVTTAFDLGSGLFEPSGAPPLAHLLGDEPLVVDAVKSGIDVVMYSGDKLFGGPQSGLVVGKRAAIAALRKNPIYRALRLDKVTLAGLEATAKLVLSGRAHELPTRRMLAATAHDLRPAADALAARLARISGLHVAVAEGASQPGSGSAPGILLPTYVVRVRHATLSDAELALALREAPVPVFTRVQEGHVLVDPRTLLPGDDADLVRGFEHAAGRDAGSARRSPA